MTADDLSQARIALADAAQACTTAVVSAPSARESFDRANELMSSARSLADDVARLRALAAAQIRDEESLSLAGLADRLSISKTRAAELIKLSQKSTDLEAPNKPEPLPVVAAIVTSAKGVLIGKRADSKPPWTFIAGEIEPGESPEDAATREVKEETGLDVRAIHVIGRRVHPKTKRTMVYMAARPTHGTNAIVADTVELIEVRWVRLPEAEQLLPGMYEPVHEYLEEVL